MIARRSMSAARVPYTGNHLFMNLHRSFMNEPAAT